jgi:hypothetical protein
MQAQTVSIGFVRDDGDLQILSTANNNDKLLSQEDFEEFVEMQVLFYLAYLDKRIYAWERQDAPDYVSEDEPLVEIELTFEKENKIDHGKTKNDS